jgi:hypothetical protein
MKKITKENISTIHIKKSIISEANSELVKKKFSQKLKCIDVSSEDKSVQFDDMKRFQHGIVKLDSIQ